MKFTYKTRGNAGPQGKPRVYLAGHPVDLAVCSEEIFADILRTQNCAIYYDGEPEAPYDEEELLRRLEQMQLFVIPVTARFLNEPNRAREVEFPFARKHDIPILPLMLEEDLDNEFNRKCGKLQVLHRHDSDPTARPYAEKLEQFLASVLVGDEMAEKIRAAFDAYVFLSYRKKDREYALQLMKLIHENEFCRDIAIWYDEFLVPGENFDDAIADAMKKCGVFTMAVTPNLLEPDNYVMSTEYPEAKKADKIILPVELVSTDRQALERAFPDIEDCTLAWDKEALAHALMAAVKKLALRENDSSPEHNFFIGLAYLNGIDVEVDRERGRALITSAAEAGLPEAMENMAETAGDSETAAHWYEKLWDYWLDRYNESGDVAYRLKELEVMLRYGDRMRRAGVLSKAEYAYDRMEIVCNDLLRRHGGSVEGRRYLATSHRRQGDMARCDHNYEYVLFCYQKSREVYQQLWMETGTAEARSDLAGSYGVLGSFSLFLNKPDEAMDYYLRALELCRQTLEETGTADAQEGVARMLENLARASQAVGNAAGEKDYWMQALALREELWEKSRDVSAWENLCGGYYRRAEWHCGAGDLIGAKNCCLQACELFRWLPEVQTLATNSHRALSSYYDLLREIRKISDRCTEEAQSSWDAGNLVRAKAYCQYSLELYERLYEAEETEQTQDDLATACYNMGLLLEGEAKKKMLERARDLWTALSAECQDETRYSRYVQQRDAAQKELDEMGAEG